MKYEWNPATAINWTVPEKEWNSPVLPMISLGVLNMNRRDDLRQTLDVLTTAIQYPKYEVIVVDNGSTDGSVEMVREEFPSVVVHEVGKNIGISARNFQAKLAKGKYLFSFDDDTIPGSPAMLLRIVQFMESRPDIDALSSTYHQPLTGLTETRGWEFFSNGGNAKIGFEGIFIVEGGVCFRLDSLRNVEGYDRAFIVYSEGMELGVQLFKAGYHSYLCPWFLTLHFASKSMRPPGLRAYANSRHMVWILAKHWPILAAIPLLCTLVFRRALGMSMHRETWRESARGLIHGFRGIVPFLLRSPKLNWGQVFRLKRFYLFFFRWA